MAEKPESLEPLSLGLENFRGFRNSTVLTFPRISVLIGRNNVGKTSTYAPLLALRQTLDARDPHTALMTRGETIDIGQFRDYVTDHDLTRKVKFTLGLPRVKRLGHPPTDEDSPAFLEVAFGTQDGSSAVVEGYRILDSDRKPILSRTRKGDGESFDFRSRLLPTSTAGRPMGELTELRRSIRREQPDGFLFSGVGALILPRKYREDPVRWEKIQDWFRAASDLYDIQTQARMAVARVLRPISYIGPVRSAPLRTYRKSAEPPRDVGRDGQLAPELLYRERDGDTLIRVNTWLAELGYGALEFRDAGDEYFQVLVRPERGVEVNLAHTGAGLAQLLPILVQGATAPGGATLIAQQPEIHLNPAQQCVATDFLIETAKAGKRVVIETHSEHVLLRLRRRIAEDKIDADDVALYYVDSNAGRSSVRRVAIEANGAIERNEWPRAFFAEQLDDSFALALAQQPKALE